MKLSDKRKAGRELGRAGISERIIELSKLASKGSYKEAIEIGGRIKVLVESATCDEYWTEKSRRGMTKEEFVLQRINRGFLSNDAAASGLDLAGVYSGEDKAK